MPSLSPQPRRRRWMLVLLPLAIALLIVYAMFDPAGSAAQWFPKCVVHTLTGLQCPGCGSQRAIHSLLQGDLVAAFRYNALLFVLIPFLVLMLISEIWPNRLPRLYWALNHRLVCLGFIVILISWTIARNILNI